MPKCQKCGVSLHPEQKVCLECGTATNLWDGGANKEEKPPMQIPWLQVGIIGGGLLLVLILVLVGLSMRVVPPDEVANKWMDTILSRNFKNAKLYTTERFESSVMDQTGSAKKSDDYYLFIHDNEAKYTFSKPEFDGSDKAVVVITLTGNNGQSLEERIHFVRQDKKWKIDLVE